MRRRSVRQLRSVGWAACCAASVVLLCLQATSEETRREPGPEEDYALHCSGCHGPAGEGVPDVVPSLDDLGALLRAPGGPEYLVRIPGVAQAPVSDARLARLLNWLAERHAGRPPESRFEAEQVGRLRVSPLRDALAARHALGPLHP